MLKTTARAGLQSCPACRVFSLQSSAKTPSTSSSSPRPTALPHPVLDLSSLLSNPENFKRNLANRRYPLAPSVVDEIRQLELDSVDLRKEIQRARERRNAVSSGTGQGGKDAREVAKAEGLAVKTLLKTLEPRLAQLTIKLQSLAIQLPNTSHPSSPIGSEDCAKTVKTHGPAISDPPPHADPRREHLQLSSPANLAWTDFPSAALVTGSSWPYLLNDGALLELALTNYAVSVALRRGFKPVLTPDVIRSDVAERCGFRPRDGEAQQTYFLSDGVTSSPDSTLCLAGTAEIPLVGMAAATTFKSSDLPLRRVGLGRAFRAEAGARGADSRGLYRVHQFSKVEMVVICSDEDSHRLLEELRDVQEEILSSLGLSLRVLEMPTEELGASAHRKYDIEAWMPGRGKWGELSSASNCTDYQSRRLGIRYRPRSSGEMSPVPLPSLEDLDIPTPAALEATAGHTTTSQQPKVAYAHTLNATAAAIPRLIVAILENGAVLDDEGKVKKVRLPQVLRRFWIGGEDLIEWVESGEALRKD